MHKRVESIDIADTADEKRLWVTAYLGLGSNVSNTLGSPKQHIETAIAQLQAHPDIRELQASSLYVSKPMGPQDQPDFLNAVLHVQTRLDAQALLAVCQHLEHNAQRQRIRHWGERSLDVDILLYGDQQINSDALTVPHAGMLQRNFVMLPLYELAPSLTLAGKPIASHAASHDWTGIAIYQPQHPRVTITEAG